LIWNQQIRQDNTNVANGCISRGSAKPPRQGAGPRPPQILEVLFCIYVHPLTQNYQICRGGLPLAKGRFSHPHLSARRCHIPTLTVSATISASSLNIQTPLLHCSLTTGRIHVQLRYRLLKALTFHRSPLCLERNPVPF